MDLDRNAGNWQGCNGKLKEHKSKLADDQLDAIMGRRKYLADKIRETSGISRDEGEEQAIDWQSAR